MRNPSAFRRTAVVILVGSLTVGITGTAGARIDRDIPSGTTVRASVLDPETDISTLIAAPRVVSRGTDFYATLSVSNLGRRAARDITCGVSTPRADAVANFALAIPTRLTYDTVEGNESHEFRLPALAAGQTQAVRMSASAIKGAPTTEFTISAHCVPAHVDQRGSNNASSVTVTVI